MNNVLELKGYFNQEKNIAGGGGNNLPANASVEVSDLVNLKDQLSKIIRYWDNKELIKGVLIDVFYNKLAAKSNRVAGLLCKKYESTNDYVVGAKFSDELKHIITYFVDKSLIEESIRRIIICERILENEFRGVITKGKISGLDLSTSQKEKVEYHPVDFNKYKISKTIFVNVIVDCHYVTRFDIPNNIHNFDKSSIVSIYDVGEDITELLSKVGININNGQILDDVVRLTKEDVNKLNESAPYLISMATEDFSKLTKDDFLDSEEENTISIPKPSSEPTIGVIDTLFDKNIYFSEWVTYEEKVDKDIEKDYVDYIHGTAVSSLIVDAPSINPSLDDGCGRFRVKHFGVATGKRFSSFTIMKSIKQVVANNPNIKVWNISLGSQEEVPKNFVSIEAAVLDKIQLEYDVIFVIAGTNKSSSKPDINKIGAPADSINSIVVNAVGSNNKKASYSREGIVLSFFIKPDVSVFGGDVNNPIRVCSPNGEKLVKGTSFAAPFISRKLAYLINVVGLSREVAKALLIDSASKWDKSLTLEEIKYLGHGIIPTHIDEILKTKDDEIRFVITGQSEQYHSYTYNLPVPTHNNTHPFIAKISMCYFPECKRNQGVDYTCTELDLYFGRIDNRNKIKPIDNNVQSIEEDSYLHENNARKYFRKWDNVKHKKEIFNPRVRPRRVYNDGMWGIAVRRKERLQSINPDDVIRFGVVVTLKELNGKNRISEFIKQCQLRGWLVNELDIDNRIDIYNKANEEILFD